MESFINSVTAGNVELTLPYAETLNNLVNYNSELTYSPSSSHSSQNQDASPLDISSKLPTKLSKNPSTYEKELRQIVIDLYSDKEVSTGEPNQSAEMFPSPGSPVVQGPGKSMDLEHKDSLKEDIVFLMKEDPGGFLEGPVNPLVQVPQLRGATYWGVERENGVATSEGSAIQSLEDLQGYLVKFQNSKQELPSRNVSFSSDLTTPSFDDSGVHLEFAVPDISEEESCEHSRNADGSQPVKQDEQQRFRTQLCDGPLFTVRGEDEESEAGDAPEIWQISPISENHEVREAVSNKNLIPGNGHEKTSDLKDKENLTRSQMFSPGVEQGSSIQRPEAKGGFLNENTMSGSKLGLDFSMKADPLVLEEVSSGQKNEFSLREVSLEAPSPKAYKSVLMERRRDRHEKRGKSAVSKAVKCPLPLPGQALPVFGLRSEIGEKVSNESDAPGNDEEKGVSLAVDGDIPRLLIPFPGQELSVASLSPQDNAGVSAFDSQNVSKEEVHHYIKDAIEVRKPLEREGCPDLELQCASLEGKLESLQGEFASVLEDRKSLQIRLQTVERRLKGELKSALETKPTAVSLVAELRQNKSELENQLRDLQSEYEEKRDNLDEALERLKTASVTIQNLKQKLLSLEGEIGKREETVSLLQAEMDSLRKHLDQAKDQNEQFKKENMVLNADIASLVDAKEWLQKQLSVAGEARMKIQLETSELESALAEKSQLIERLRCEGARSNQQLTELQQSSLVEKEQILKHMEQVEEGITQQDLAFKELELDKQRIERTLGAKIESLTNENQKFLKLVNSAVEMEKELDAAKQDVVLKETLLDTIMKDKDEIKEQLNLARVSTEEYKRNLNELESKFNKTKEELKKAKEDLGEKDCYIEKLQEDKRILEGSLEVANEERAACDNAIHTLKLDLEKVDRRFKLMKRELTVKKGQLEETTRQKDVFVSELRSVREGLENQVNLSRAAKEQLAQKEKLIEEFQEVKEALGKEMGLLAQQVEDSEDQIARVENEKDDIQQQLESAVREMVQLQDKFHQSLLERARLEGELETTQQSNHQEMESLRSLNASLREEIKVEKINLQVEVTKERDKVINLEQELKFIMNEMSRKESQYTQELQVVEERLEETKRRKEIAEQELKRLREVTERGTVELKRNFESQLEKLQKDVCGLQQEKLQLEQKYDALIKKTANDLDVKSREMSHMENEVSSLKGVLQKTKAEAEKMQLCAVELEREKGRLAGVLASQRTLREHVVKMENEIATRESTLLEMTSEVDRLKKENEVQRKTATERVERLETQLNSVRLETRKLQDSFRKERHDNVSLRSQVEEGASERVEVMKKLSIAEKEIKQLQGKIKSEGNESQRYRSEIEVLKGNLLEQQTEQEKLQRKLEAALERDFAKSGRVESLEWELNRRKKEVEYLKEQVRMMEERQQLELENLKTALQVSRSETTSLRSELSEARKAKCGYQTKTFELKDSLLSARQVTESIKQELFGKRQELNSLLSDVLFAGNLKALQEQTAKKMEAMADCAEIGDDTDAADGVPTSCPRPVSGLQECMSSLRSQISSLQKQMNDHTDSVLTATTSWRSFKENVHQLQASCSSQNNQLLTAEKDN